MTNTKAPLKRAFSDHGGAVLKVVGLNLAPAATYYIFFVYAAAWLANEIGMTPARALNITTASILTFLAVLPIAAWASDQFGRKRLLVTGMATCLVLAYPLTSLMQSGSPFAVAIAQMTFSGVLALYMAPIPAAICEMFPHTVRVSAVSVGYGLAYAVFGANAPAIAVWLIGQTGNKVAFVWYLVAATAISLGVALTTRDRHLESLDLPLT